MAARFMSTSQHSSFRDEQGEPICFVGIKHDITERKRVEAALRRSEAELADFFDNASIGLHWVDPDGIVLRVNQSELDLLGYTREEYVGHHISEFHADKIVIENILNRLAAGEVLRDFDARMLCKDRTVKARPNQFERLSRRRKVYPYPLLHARHH